MHDNDVDSINFNHTAVYTHIVIACDGPKIRMCAKSDNTAMTTDLIVIRYDKCYIDCRNMLRLCVGAMTHVLIVIVGLA